MELFSNAEEGDRVWSDRLGWGIIKVIDSEGKVYVVFDKICSMPYFLDGRRHKEDTTNELHWDEIEYTEPVKVPELG